MTAWEIVAAVPDPEMPTLTLEDLGVLRSVSVDQSGSVQVTLTPTYSGCPAMDAIRADVQRALRGAGYRAVAIHFELAPAWTTDQLGPLARQHLAEVGIAPPAESGAPVALSLKCPQCGSFRTREVSHFGATSCKALWQCSECGEPFEHLKALR
ncbi:MAG TPA: 1,2-phenylacetyl-CoA epoxidase subunit PaaD [Candidatus Nanopelagicaceae bacterium]|nr:1,2-phenylacetyl-CoA epoxidase subunit PaaD [Candidatus Nanopelagicaceae bacterium]